MRDIKRFAIAHDFTWTEKELADMVHCFDSDRDGKVGSCCYVCFVCLIIIEEHKC